MAFAVDFRRIGAALLAVGSTALLVWFGTGLNPWWPLFWFAPLPALIFALRSSWWAAFLTAFLAFALGNLNLWHYFKVALGAPIAIRIEILAIPALVVALAVLLFRALLNRGASWSALLAFPSTWVAFEYLFNLTSPHGTAMSLSYSQLNCLPVLQLAAITGPWGISFLLLSFPAALAIGFHLRHTAPRQALRVVGATLLACVLVLIFGTVRLALPSAGPTVRVGLVASDLPSYPGVAAQGAQTERLLHDYAAQAETLAARGAQVIVLPEHLGEIEDPNTAAADAVFQSLADKSRSTIVVGLSHVSLPLMYNQARVFAPGAQVLSYNKHHLLPPFESMFTPGSTLALMPEPSGTWGVAICKDMDFTQLSRQYGKADAGLLLVPAWDFVLDRFSHGHIAVMRGVESGFSIARAARGGYLTVSDNRGRILAETQSDSAPFATLLADVPSGHESTIYLLFGDWFAWLVLAILAVVLAQLRRSRNACS
jgi:apolipoprotein N-acyltransferase